MIVLATISSLAEIFFCFFEIFHFLFKKLSLFSKYNHVYVPFSFGKYIIENKVRLPKKSFHQTYDMSLTVLKQGNVSKINALEIKK